MNYRFLQYMRRLDCNLVKMDSYKKIIQENNVKKSFSKVPCMDPYKEYKLIRQSNESML